jgi:hypothetical protein
MAALALVAGCSREKPPPAPADDRGVEAALAAAPRPRFGAVMAEVGRRFELAGRAASANRFELADFEVGELQELFENDVPRAELPQEGATAHIPALAKAFLETFPAQLESAARAKDEKAFAAAFQRAAAACNACHAASDKKFIEVPSLPGKSVPSLDALPPTSP